MCGFLIFMGNRPVGAADRHAVARLLPLVHHRGPDDAAVTTVDGAAVIGFNRLAIIDREGSRQPLTYPPCGPQAGRWTIALNGEIYNFEELRDVLRRECGAVFVTAGDAEVAAAAFHHWGPSALHRLRGMFAFVIWDRLTATAYAARDLRRLPDLP